MPKFPPLRNLFSQKRITFESMPYRISKGSFSKVSGLDPSGALKVKGFVFCREYFQNQSAGIRRILFVVPYNKAYSVAAFMDKIETKLHLKTRSKFGPTQRNDIMWIKASPWWTQSSMKRSLFTALLRCGANYKPLKDNFEEALYSTEYTRSTKYAIQRFLKGYTYYVGKKTGWYKQFRWGGGSYWKPRSLNQNNVKKLLLKPK